MPNILKKKIKSNYKKSKNINKTKRNINRKNSKNSKNSKNKKYRQNTNYTKMMKGGSICKLFGTQLETSKPHNQLINNEYIIKLLGHIILGLLYIIDYDTEIYYFNTSQYNLKIPFFSQYNNVDKYLIIDKMIKAWQIKYNDDNIYLIYQKVENFNDLNESQPPYVLFRPHAFYMDEITKNTSINFYGKLEIHKITVDSITQIVNKDRVSVHWHDLQFSPSEPKLTFEELKLNPNTSNLYFVIFKPDDKIRPIFKGFFIIDVIPKIKIEDFEIIDQMTIITKNNFIDKFIENINDKFIKEVNFKKK
jgi:hypothetical protein